MKKITLPQEFMYEFTLDKTLVESYLEQVKNSNIDWKKINDSTGNPDSNNIYLGYPVPNSQELFDALHVNLNKVANIHFTKNVELKICDVWLTQSNFGNRSVWHKHTLSLFSGLLYLQDSDVHTEFLIANNFYTKYSDLYGEIADNINSVTKVEIKPAAGKLIIWPSYIGHKIAVHKEKQTRYTLAFNSFFNGVLNTKTTARLTLNVDQPEFL